MSKTGAPAQAGQIDPNDPEELIASSIYWFPLLFENRTDVLNHLLLIGGNGYEWDDQGRIVTCFPDQPLRSDDPDELWPDHDGLIDEDWRQAQIAPLALVRAEYAERARTTGPVKVYGPGHCFARSWGLLSRKPNRVHPSWQGVIAEAEQLFAAAWKAQDDAVAVRQSELDADRLPNAARIALRLVDDGYARGQVSREEHRSSRAALATIVALPDDAVALDAEHDKTHEMTRLVSEALGRTSGVSDPDPLPQTRTFSGVLAGVLKQAKMADQYRGPRPVPNLEFTDVHWLDSVARDLLAACGTA